MPNFFIVYPEVVIAIVATVVLLLELGTHKDAYRRVIHAVSLLGLLAAAVLSAKLLHSGAVLLAFNDMFVSDPLANLAKLFSFLCVAVIFIYSQRYAMERGFLHGEFYSLSLFSLVGQMVMISANNLMSLYMGLELQALSLYAMVALRRDNVRSIEAAMKYFILGAIASGLLLFGMSLVYGATGGSLGFTEIANKVASGHAEAQMPILVMGLVFLVAGVAFKLGVVPFHMWVPDVYQGSPTPVSMMIASAPKIAAFMMVVRMFVQALPHLSIDWQMMFAILAVLSLILGNLAAIRQKSYKRMLAYSGISHMGFVLLGLLSARAGIDPFTTALGVGAAFYYVIVYAITTLASFGAILAMTHVGFEADHLDDFKGLNQRNPWLAFLLLLVMFSLAGIPPLVGFMAKFVVIQGLINAGLFKLALVAVLFSLIGAFYYLRVVKLMYFDKPEKTEPIRFSMVQNVVLSVNALALIVLGILPNGLIQMAVNAVLKSLSV